MLWIEFTDEEGNEGAARWGKATDEQIDLITNFAEKILGRPDTVA